MCDSVVLLCVGGAGGGGGAPAHLPAHAADHEDQRLTGDLQQKFRVLCRVAPDIRPPGYPAFFDIQYPVRKTLHGISFYKT